MTKDKKSKVASVIADIVLFGFLTIILLAYIVSLDGIKSGVDTNYAEGHMIYGIDVFLDNFRYCGIIFLGTHALILGILYDLMFLIIKWGRKTLKKYQLIGIIATFLLIIVGVVLCVLSGNLNLILLLKGLF